MVVEVGGGRPPSGAPGARLGVGLLPPVRRSRRTGRVLIAALTVVAAGLATALVVSRITVGPVASTSVTPSVPAVLAQYDYTLRLPAGWRHSGGLPERRRTLLTPAATPDGSDLVSVEQTALGYDSAAEPDRAYRELHDRFQHEAAADPSLTGLTMSTTYAGRDVIAYHQALPIRGAEVDWYVLFDRDAQLSVGCQHTRSGVGEVGSACAQVVASLARRSPIPPPR
jgi:type VII secretion-associated protein (TIGR03931 family)